MLAHMLMDNQGSFLINKAVAEFTSKTVLQHSSTELKKLRSHKTKVSNFTEVFKPKSSSDRVLTSVFSF